MLALRSGVLVSGLFACTDQAIHAISEVDEVRGPDIAVVPTALDYGDVELEQAVVLDFEVRNQGDVVLAIDALQLSGAGDFTLIESESTVPGGDLVSVDVVFAPMTDGEHQGFVNVLSDDEDEPLVAVQLRGLGLAEVEDTAPPIDTSPPEDTAPPEVESCRYTSLPEGCDARDGSSPDDVDGDGVANDCDYCPGTDPGLPVTSGGCACDAPDTYLVSPPGGANDGTDIGSVTAGKDTSFYGDSGNGWDETNYGDSPSLRCSQGSPTGWGRCMLRFELSALPEDAVLGSATLTLNAPDHGSSYGYGVPRNFYVQPVTADWDEMVVAGTTQPPVDETVISPAAWCGFEETSPCEIDVLDVLDFLRDNENHGLRVRDDEQNQFTRSFGTSDHEEVTDRPSLVVTYAVPD